MLLDLVQVFDEKNQGVFIVFLILAVVYVLCYLMDMIRSIVNKRMSTKARTPQTPRPSASTAYEGTTPPRYDDREQGR